jgi:integrase
MVQLVRDSNGAYKARKRLPEDVREKYGCLYGQSHEAKFSQPSNVTPQVAKQRFSEWLADVEGKIAAIRSERTGEGRSLSHREARALAGEWYDWFIARHPFQGDRERWEQTRDAVHEALRDTAGEARYEASDPDELWRTDENLRRQIRPLLADFGETAQFLAMKRTVLNNEARALFLDFLYEDLSAALKQLRRHAEGDYGPDKHREQFPRPEAPASGLRPFQLFERWAEERRPSQSTIESWRYVFRAMESAFPDRSAASITEDEARTWIKSLVGPERSAATVSNTWLNASNTVFRWALLEKLLSENPFKSVAVTVPKKIRHRETAAFYLEEQKIILSAALDIGTTDKPDNAAKRWVPWLCAYTGARVGEITQLRKSDVLVREGIHAIRITPDAGTVKNRRARLVPLHDDLIRQGFLQFVSRHKDGPLFYNPDTKPRERAKVDKKPRYAQARQRLAQWVRGLGISDKELQPNHAWRHTFKQIADHAEISERTSNYITGHAQRNEGANYGAPTLKQLADAMKKFPKYVLDGRTRP